MVAQTKVLTENVRTLDYPRTFQDTYLSTRAKFVIKGGTYQQVVDFLDAQGTPEHKVKGFQFVSAGKCQVIVHKQ